MDTIEFLYSIIGTPLGYIMWAIYEFICKNTGASIGIAILIFTFLVKLAMLPLSIRQQKNSAKSAIFAPKVREIQEKYKNNQEKQQQELAKLQQQGYSPMGGCGTMLITFLLLFGVLDVVYKPMTHIKHMNNISAILQDSYYVSMTDIFVEEYNNTTVELTGDALTKHEEIIRDAGQVLRYYNENKLYENENWKLEKFEGEADETVWQNLDRDSKKLVTAVIKDSMTKSFTEDNGNDLFTETDLYVLTKAEQSELEAIGDETEKAQYRQAHSFSSSTRSAVETVQKRFGSVKASLSGDDVVISYTQAASLQRELYAIECYGHVIDKDPAAAVYTLSDTDKAALKELDDKLEFIGIPLGQEPANNMGWPMILIPILAFVFSMAQTLISNKTMEINNPGTNSGCMKATMFIMPLFSVVLVFTVPAGAGFYWTISYAFGIIQTLLLNKLYSPAKLRAQAEAEYNERMKAAAKEEKRKRMAADENAVAEYKGEKLTQKEINRRKLAEARKADALKYGEEYNEEDDKDD
ncbi:MAG: YidC/Oxa1 family membrane protein insertase [Oscillospiraceae bacterium]